MQKALFLRFGQLEVDEVTIYDKEYRHKCCFKSLQKCFRHAKFYIDRMMSNLITKHLCNYRINFHKQFYFIFSSEIMEIISVTKVVSITVK